MRWVFLAILIYLLVLAQTTLAGILTFRMGGVGLVGPDLLAVLAVYVALRARAGVDVMLSAWLMGFAVDLTTGAGADVSTVVGVMSLGYVLGAGAVFRMREVMFRENILVQCVLTAVFCVIAHGFWVTVQWFLGFRTTPWSGYFQMLLQALLLSVYTAALMPLGRAGLRRCERWIIAASTDRPGRRRR